MAEEEKAPAPAPPIPEYDTLTVEQIEKWAASTSDAQRALAIAYESRHKKRAEVLKTLRREPFGRQTEE